jgi:glycosyltransferase involved in cell wall biosynthesis
MLTQFFDPEPHSKGLSFARELARRGHEVEVLTGFPNYPGGKVYSGYRVRPWQREVMDGIPVNRVALYPSHDTSAARRVANYISFAVSASAIGPFVIKRPDVIHVYHPPGTMGLPAMVLRALRGAPVVYDIQDLWPDTVASSGMMGNRWALRALDRWCRLAYSRMDRIAVLSPGFRRALIARGVAADKIDVIYNWAEESRLDCAGQDESLKRELGMAGRFNVVFAGTMGLVQKLDAVLDAARICAATVPNAQFVFVGGGVDKARLEQRAKEMQLPNTLFLPRQPREKVGEILAMADALLVHLKDDPLFHITIPSKTQAYLAVGRPIVMAVAGDAADLIEQSRAGITCPPENPAALAAAVEQLNRLAPSERQTMGARGKEFYDKHLSLRVGVKQFEDVFQAAIRGKRMECGCRHDSLEALTEATTREESNHCRGRRSWPRGILGRPGNQPRREDMERSWLSR